MKRQVLTILVGLAVLLSACGGQAASPTPTSVASAPTVTPAAPATSTTVESPVFKLEPAVACQSYSGIPDPVPGIPPVGAGDWSKGPANAPAVLLEYADYQ